MKLLMTKLSRWKVMDLFFLLYCLFFMANIGFSSPIQPDESSCPTLCVCSRTTGVVNCSHKGLKEIPEDVPKWVNNLSLRGNKISSSGLSSFNLSSFPYLKELDLSGNKIQSFTVDIAGTYLLNKLVLDHCSLSSFPDTKLPSNITYLSLSHNSITDIGSTLKNYSNLTSLDLSYNKIKNLKHNTFATLKRLTHLSLQRNRISSLDWRAFIGLISIESIDLSRNRIRNIVKPEKPKPVSKQEICDGNFTNLKHIDLSRNQLSLIHGLAFSGMCNLVSIHLQNNRINTLRDGAFYGPQGLKTLILHHNHINVVKRGWLFELSSLETLSLSVNNISRIEPDGWDFCKELMHLNLSFNHLSSLSANGFSKLGKLQTLRLDHNKVTVMEDNAFTGLGALKILDISFNEISSSIEDINGAFLGLTSIEHLSLRSNNVRTLSASVLEGLENVVTLDLRENDVTSIQNHTFDKMLNLRSLQIISSSFLCDCQISWFPAWLEFINDTREEFKSAVHGTCFHPPALLGKDILTIKTSEFVCGDHPIPVLLQEPTSLTALRGENITLECSASATFSNTANVTTSEPDGASSLGDSVPGDSPSKTNPSRESFLSLQAEETKVETKRKDKMMITWKRGQEIIHHGGQIKIENHTRHEAGYVYFTSTLVLNGVTSNDDGLYSCIISNKYGYDRSKPVRLEVNEYPHFIKMPVNVTTVRNGSEAILDCSATGQPSPQITWQKDGGKDFPAASDRRLLREQKIFRAVPKDEEDVLDNPGKGHPKNPLLGGSSSQISSKDNSKAKFTVDTDAPLHIGVVLPEDAGEYECVVQSSVGRIVAKAILVVEFTPVFSKPMEPTSKTLANQSAVIHCSVEGIPAPKVSWFFNGVELNQTMRHFLAGEGQVLVITDVKYSDAGEYSCEAVNHLGSIGGQTNLEVYEKASELEPVEDFLTMIFGDNTTTGVIVITMVIVLVIFVIIVWICYRRKNPEQAMSTNTDETDLPPDVHSCVSTDEDIRKAQSSHSIHLVENQANGHVPTKGKGPIGYPYRGSASTSDIHLMQILPPTRPRNPSESSNHIVRSFPRRCQSSMVIKDKPLMKRFQSAENFRIGENQLLSRTPPPNSQRRVNLKQPLVTPSSYFAKKAATQETYVPVHLKNRENPNVRNASSNVLGPSSSSTNDTADSRNRSKKLKKVKVHNQRKLKQQENDQNETTDSHRIPNGNCQNNDMSPKRGQNWGVGYTRSQEQSQTPINHNRKQCDRGHDPTEEGHEISTRGLDFLQTADSAKLLHDDSKNAETWRSYYYRERRKNGMQDVSCPPYLTPGNCCTRPQTNSSSSQSRPAETSSDSLEPAAFSSENTLVSESSALLSSESASSRSDSVAPPSAQESERLLTSRT